MQFGPTPVAEAEGGILAHAVRAGEHLFKKGRVLSAADIGVLKAAGCERLVIARLEAGDVGEDEAAGRLAAKCGGEHVRARAPFTGRANLYADAPGLVLIDAERVNALNRIDEAITLATLAPYAKVTPRQMLATIKIIPFAAPRAAVERAERILDEGPIFHVAPFRPMRAALISTALPTTNPALLDRNRTALDSRLAALGSEIIFERRVAHDEDALAPAILEAETAGADPILVFGASAITDRRDVIPAAVAKAGGRVQHFGMPVDPGNLLLLGEIGSATVIGLPGCARAPKLNGFDFVLWRVLAGLTVNRADIAAMGLGGLLAEIPTRRQPRDEPASTAPRAPRIGAIILAAGQSSRMGANKLLMEVGGKPMLRRVAEAAIASHADPVIVVTGHASDAVKASLEDLPLQVTNNSEYSKGLSTSLRAGINGLPEDCDGALVLLGDMPGVKADLIDRMIAAFDPGEDRAICVAAHDGRRGNPVLWARRFFPEILAIEGDGGARNLIAAYNELICEIEAADAAPLLDIDTPEALVAYRDTKPEIQ